jgi:UMF1 family MFS transporter
MEGGLVFYNSFLPEITDKEYQGRVSAWGYALGYAGSILSLLFVLPLVKNGRYHETWFTVSLFFLVFALPAFFYLPRDRKNGLPVFGAAAKGVRYSLNTMKEILKNRPLRRFMLAYFIYEDGVNTVIVFSSIFASVTLKFDVSELILLFMLVQVTALSGAFLMAKPIDAWGPKRVLLLSLLVWSFVSITAFFIESKIHFWVLASVAGLGLGTVQAASRAFFINLSPLRESEYFECILWQENHLLLWGFVFGAVSSVFGNSACYSCFVIFFCCGLFIISCTGGGPNINQRDNIS